MKSLHLALTAALLASSTAQEVQHCHALTRFVKILSTTTDPISIFELSAMGENGVVDWASTDTNPQVVATQSSDYKGRYIANNAVDGDLSTFSQTNNGSVGDEQWLQVDLGTSHTLGSVQIKNRSCKNMDDERECLCRLSQARVWLLKENGHWINGQQLGDTCGQEIITVTFPPQIRFCDFDAVISPRRTIDAGLCQDDPNFETGLGLLCDDIAFMDTDPFSDKVSVCNEQVFKYSDEEGNPFQVRHFCPVACGDCVAGSAIDAGIDTAGVTAGADPTYSPTYVPSAQPISTANIIPVDTAGVDPTYSPTYVPSAQPISTANIIPVDTAGVDPTYSPTYVPSAQPVSTANIIPVDTAGVDPTYSPTYVPSAQPVSTANIIPVDTAGVDPTYSPTYVPSAQPVSTTSIIQDEPTYSPTYLPSANPISGVAIIPDEDRCLPFGKSVKVISTTDEPIAMFELSVLDIQGSAPYESSDITMNAVASQSSTLREYDASRAIDGDINSFSMTDYVADSWWQVDLGEPFELHRVTISNRWCGDPSDASQCLCRLSQAKVWVYDENGQWIAGKQLGDTCGKTKISVQFPRDAKYCKTDTVVSPKDKVQAGVCQDDPNFLSIEGDDCATIATVFGSDSLMCSMSSGVLNLISADGSFYLNRHFCPVACGDCDANAEIAVEPTYSPTYLPSAQPIAAVTLTDTKVVNDGGDFGVENDKLFGHAYSAGDVCEDDATFVSNKGITCKSFVYAESVYCRSSTGMHDAEFNALRYSDFCPKTCGMCAEVAAATIIEESNAKGVALGVGLTVFTLVVMLVAWMFCRSRHTGKSTVMMSSRNEYRDDAQLSENRGEYRDEVGATETNEAKIAETVGETVAKTDIV